MFVIMPKSDNLSANTERLLKLLENQYLQEIERQAEYCKLVHGVKNPLLKLYFDAVAFDTSKHVYILSSLIPRLKQTECGQSSDMGLPFKELGRLRDSKKASEDVYLKCLELTNDEACKLLIKTMILDEDHHFKLVTELLTICAKSAHDKNSASRCSSCGYELPKTVTLNGVPKDMESKVREMLLTIYCPRCNTPYYSITGKGENKNHSSCYS